MPSSPQNNQSSLFLNFFLSTNQYLYLVSILHFIAAIFNSKHTVWKEMKTVWGMKCIVAKLNVVLGFG